MFVTDVNEVKIYNLSAGKSLPQWLTDRKKRSQLKKNVDSRKQIELIQDFDMPGVSTAIRMSPDNQYILATGTYKPRVKCFEVLNLSIKFERCFDSEVTTFEIISDDYSKMVFLQCDRFIEIHSAQGRHYRLRIPRFGRDMKYHSPSCDLFIVGTSSDIYRLNLERGQFLQPYQSSGSALNVCEVNNEHNLLLVGTKEGTVEAWDPRDRHKCATLDVAVNLPESKIFPSISALKFKNGLQLAVGTNSGQVLLYDIRSSAPTLVKDHLNKLPVKRIHFNAYSNAVCSLDSAMLKIWDESTGKQIAFIESQTDFNDFCTIPDTGMFFLAQEDVKMLTYYIPHLGPAPKWCSFLDNLAEEIESEVVEHIYDDYKFVTKRELEELDLDHLIGTTLLRAYMHGYFINIRLYNKAKSISEPFAFEQFRKEKIRQQVEAQRPSRLQINTNLPKVNKELAMKILDESSIGASGKKKGLSLLEDDRFKQMFENPDFTINTNAEAYKLLAPALNRLSKAKQKVAKQNIEVDNVQSLHAEENMKHQSSDEEDENLFQDSDNDSEGERSESSDDDVREYSKEMKKAYKEVKKDREERELEEAEESDEEESNEVAEFKPSYPKQKSEKTLLERLAKVSPHSTGDGNFGNKQMKFEVKSSSSKLSKEMKKREFEMRKHRDERRKLSRSSKSLKLKKINLR